MLLKKLSILSIAGVLSLCLAAIPGQAATADVYIIGASGNLPANLGPMVSAAGGTLQRTHSEIGIAQATATDPSFAAKMAANSGIQYVVQDSIVQWTPPPSAVLQGTMPLPSGHAAAPNPQGAFFYACQWGLPQINAPGRSGSARHRRRPEPPGPCRESGHGQQRERADPRIFAVWQR
jgi:hypothetical protein